MNDQEDLRHLIQQNHEQMQRQFKQIQAQVDHIRAERSSRNLGRDSDMDRILPCCCRWRRDYLRTILWALAMVGLILGCAWNFGQILQDMIESPTVTKMTSTFHDKLPLPPITVYQFDGIPMLHTEKLFKALEDGSLTQAYLEAIIKGIGIKLLDEQNTTVQPSEITEAYKQAILQYGSLTEAGLAFQKEYGIACDELFMFCGDKISPPMNCCDVFEVIWGLTGLQYALQRNTIFLGAFREFRVILRSVPNMEALQKGDFVQQPGNYQSYLIGISNEVDQSGFDVHLLKVQPSEVVSVLLRQKRRNIKIPKHCVDLPPKLRYFQEYTISHCFVERCILDKLPLCNITCELPVLQLMNPDNLSGPPCEFDVVNSTCLDIIQANQPRCSTNHGCRFPCNYTEVEYSVTTGLQPRDQREIMVLFKFETTEVQMFEETLRLTLWEYLGLIGSILDLWLGITIYSLHRMLHRGLSKITRSKPNDIRKNHSAAANSVSAYPQHEMANLSMMERDRRIRSSNRSFY